MDAAIVSGVANLATGMAPDRLMQQVSMTVLTKALDLQAAGAIARVLASAATGAAAGILA